MRQNWCFLLSCNSKKHCGGCYITNYLCYHILTGLFPLQQLPSLPLNCHLFYKGFFSCRSPLIEPLWLLSAWRSYHLIMFFCCFFLNLKYLKYLGLRFPPHVLSHVMWLTVFLLGFKKYSCLKVPKILPHVSLKTFSWEISISHFFFYFQFISA